MGSVVLPLLRPSRFGGTKVILFLVWLGLMIPLVLLVPNEMAHFWLFFGLIGAGAVGNLLLEVQHSQRAAVLPGFARRMRYDVLFVLALMLAAVGSIQWLVSGPVGATTAFAAWGLALGLRTKDKQASPFLRATYVLVCFTLVYAFVRNWDLSSWMADHWIVSMATGLLVLTYSAIQLSSTATVRDRPFLDPAPPRDVRRIHFANRNRSTKTWLGRPRLFRLQGRGTSIWGWVRAARFESSFGHAGGTFSLLNWAASAVILLVVAGLVMLLDFYFGARTQELEWMGLVEHFRRSVLGASQGLFVALLWGLTLFAASGLRHDFPYPLSRRRRWQVAFLASLEQNASTILAGLAFVATVALFTLSAPSTLVSGPLPAMVRGLLVVSLLAPVFQWQRAVGRRDWLQGDSIGRPFQVIMFLALYLATAFTWRGVFSKADLSIELLTYGVLLVTSQLMYCFGLRQYFRRADLVSNRA